MKTLLILFVFSSVGLAFPVEVQDSTQNRNKEKEQVQMQEQNQQQNQNEDDKLRNRIQNELYEGKDGKKRGKDVFIDKDGDGIADTRAGGMSFEKIRKRVRTGQQGSGGHGGKGNDGIGFGGNGGGK